MDFRYSLHTAGDGFWSRAEKTVQTTRFEVDVFEFDEDFGELRVYFDRNTWNVHEDGLIYTDSLFKQEVMDKLHEMGFPLEAATDISYSEQGMQGNDFVSFDIDRKFIQAYLNMLEKV